MFHISLAENYLHSQINKLHLGLFVRKTCFVFGHYFWSADASFQSDLSYTSACLCREDTWKIWQSFSPRKRQNRFRI